MWAQISQESFPRRETTDIRRDIFTYWESTTYTDLRWLAYILATAYRETVGTMQPVREGLCKSDECSIQKVTAHVGATKVKDNYSLPDRNGRSYFGRGFVQITHKRNYKRVGQALGWGDELVNKPELALDRQKAIPILVEGSTRGLFTGKKLGDCFNDKESNWIGARKVVNPGSKRARIPAEHGKDFYSCFVS
ncbi:MAG: glycoside hydrolase family 19 protein [Gammaproteobacteria bacterium]